MIVTLNKKEKVDYFLLEKKLASLKTHIIIVILFGWWALFIPNLVYHIAMTERKRIYFSD